MNTKNQLTQINEGKLHHQNPLGGVPMGQGNSVEQGETLSGNFVYSNRIILDPNMVSQFNLPKSLVGKSVADATKLIDKKFEGRNDKISQSTRKLMLDKVAQAQEALKPQEPEMQSQQELNPEMMQQEQIDPTQMAYGGYKKPMFNGGFKESQFGAGLQEGATGEQVAGTIGAGVNVLSTGLELGNVAFGKAAQNTDGLAASGRVGGASMIGGNALKGASAGAAFGPLGAGIGAAVGGIAGLVGLGKARKAETLNTQRFAKKTNDVYSDQYAMGGLMQEIDPKKKTITSLTEVNNLSNTTPGSINPLFNTKKIVRYQPGVMNNKMGSGFYLYSKNVSEPGFNVNRDREFVKQAEMMAVQRTPEWKAYMQNEALKKSQVNHFAFGGPIKPPTSIDNIQQPLNVLDFQKFALSQDKNALPKYGADGKWGNEGSSAYKKYGDEYNQFLDLKNIKLPSDINKSDFKPETPTWSPVEAEEMFQKQLTEKNNKKLTFSKITDSLGQAARYAPIAANALQLAQLKKPQGERLDRLSNRYKPEYVDEASLQNIADQTMNNSVNAIGQSGASQGQLRSSIIGSQLQRTKALSDAYNSAASQNRATNDRAQTFNLGVDQVNLNQSNTEKDINARDQAAYRNEKSKYISAIGNDIGDVGKEQVQKKMISTATGYTYDGKYVRSADGNVVIDPETKEPMTGEKLKIQQSSKNVKKQALGGYLIKNKIK